ncbi:MAG: hypothetical protein KBI10_02210 [Syntrophorhabdales bacterium]|nr:hypothetical protein [Syntrophorhabdales bacterium]
MNKTIIKNNSKANERSKVVLSILKIFNEKAESRNIIKNVINPTILSKITRNKILYLSDIPARLYFIPLMASVSNDGKNIL